MPILETGIEGLKIFEPTIFGDTRGYFLETYQQLFFKENGIDVSFVQDNESMSNYGVVRGLHYQQGEFAQSKIVRVIVGEVLDVVVDIRKGSPTFGKKFEILLSGENKKMLFVPRGFAHGFSVLKDGTIFSYKCDNYYSPKNEGGISILDPALNIDWRVPADKMLISEKDKLNPNLADCINTFEYGKCY